MQGYLKIKNSDGKVWLLPKKGLKVGLCLYQPSLLKGKLLKRLLPLLANGIWIGAPIYAKFGISCSSNFLSHEVCEYLNNIYYEHRDVLYAAFLGTPSVHQKTTIQAYCGNNILGYCKITNSRSIFSIFQHEQRVLGYLRNKGIDNIPRCIACEQINDNLYSFVQTTRKTLKSSVTHRLSEKELEFLDLLRERTTIQKSYEDTDYCRSITYLLEHLPQMEKNGLQVDILKEAIFYIEKYCSESIHEYSFCHRDFTPWNMFHNEATLFVFDFEYSRYEYPANLDLIHYFIQTAIFEEQLGAKEIFDRFSDVCQKGILKNRFLNFKLSMLMYLLDIISLYLEREKDMFSGDVKHNMDIWVSLCKIILNNFKR